MYMKKVWVARRCGNPKKSRIDNQVSVDNILFSPFLLKSKIKRSFTFVANCKFAFMNFLYLYADNLYIRIG